VRGAHAEGTESAGSASFARALRSPLPRGCSPAVSMLIEIRYVYSNRENLPDLGPFVRFELPTIGRVFDANGQPLIELAREYREITRYEDIPPVVRDAILAAEDKRFFSHNGVDYWSLPRVLTKARAGMLIGRLLRGGRHDEIDGRAVLLSRPAARWRVGACLAVSAVSSFVPG
jgi:membrane peptidoglycan carboxypeptidase